MSDPPVPELHDLEFWHFLKDICCIMDYTVDDFWFSLGHKVAACKGKCLEPFPNTIWLTELPELVCIDDESCTKVLETETCLYEFLCYLYTCCSKSLGAGWIERYVCLVQVFK